MTVAELIEQLSTFPQSLEVMVDSGDAIWTIETATTQSWGLAPVVFLE